MFSNDILDEQIVSKAVTEKTVKNLNLNFKFLFNGLIDKRGCFLSILPIRISYACRRVYWFHTRHSSISRQVRRPPPGPTEAHEPRSTGAVEAGMDQRPPVFVVFAALRAHDAVGQRPGLYSHRP